MKRFTTRKTAQLGLLFALAMALSFLEMQITPLLGLAPGVKPGLANVVVMYSMVSMGAFSGLVLTLLKAGFVLMVQGPDGGGAEFMRRALRIGRNGAGAQAERDGLYAGGYRSCIA